MEKTLHFLAVYNAQIIQVGFGIVFLLIIVYVYRQFFMANMSDSPSMPGDGLNVGAIDQKLNIIIDQQQKAKAHVAAAPVLAQENPAVLVEMDKLKTEIYNLRQQLGESEKTIADLKENAVKLPDPGEIPEGGDVADPSEFKNKIRELESRLAEYEIIADDIAELSQLRADNAKLIEQLAHVRAGSDIGSTTSLEETAAEVKQVNQVSEEVILNQSISAQPVVEEPAVAATSEASADDISALLEAYSASGGSPKAKAESKTDEVSGADQNLIAEFELNVLKKKDEE